MNKFGSQQVKEVGGYDHRTKPKDALQMPETKIPHETMRLSSMYTEEDQVDTIRLNVQNMKLKQQQVEELAIDKSKWHQHGPMPNAG